MKNNWLFGQWETGFINNCEPSIEFLELFALCAGLFTWNNKIVQTRVILYCDNISVVHMVNNLSARCLQSMKLIRLLALDNLKHDRRVYIQHIEGKNNILSHALSRINLKRFFKKAPKSVNQYPDKINPMLWPLTKIWIAETFMDIFN